MISTQKICGIAFEVKVCSPALWNRDAMGRGSQVTQTILISDELKKEMADQTILHEVVHMILDMNGFQETQNESMVSVLSNCLYSYIKDNPEVIKGWVK